MKIMEDFDRNRIFKIESKMKVFKTETKIQSLELLMLLTSLALDLRT